MRHKLYNINSGDICQVAWVGENNSTVLTFEGYEMDNERNALFLVLDGTANIPLADYSILIDHPLSASRTTFRACLMEVNDGGDQVFKSAPFTIKVEKSADASEEYESVDERLELVYLKQNELYHRLNDYAEQLKERVDSGEFQGAKGDKGDDGYTPIKGKDYFDGKDGYTPIKGKDYFDGKDGYTPIKGVDYFDGEKGDDYVITSSDYEAIAERTKELVPPYDDTEIREELHRTDDRLDALWKINEGQTYDVLESASEDYAKVVPSGAKYMSLDMVGGKSVVSKNLIDIDNATRGNNRGIVGTVNGDGSVTFSGTFTESGFGGIVTIPSIDVNGTYTFSIDKSASIGLLLVNNSWVSRGTIFAGETSKTFNVENEVIDRMCVTGTVGDSINFTIRPQLEKGSTATPYEPYFEGIKSSQVDAVEVQGKNLFDGGYVRRCLINSGKPAFTGNSEAVTPPYIATQYRGAGFTAEVEEGKTYTVSLNSNCDGVHIGVYGSIEDTTDYNKCMLSNTSQSQREITIPKGGRYIVVGMIAYSEKSLVWDSLQIEKGTTATSYSPYSKQTITTSFPTLRSAGSVYDYIDLNKGELHRRVGVAMFDALTWTKGYSSRSGMYYYEAEVPNVAENRVGRTPNMLTEYYTNPTGNQYPTSVNYGVYVASNRFITIYTESTPVGTLCYELLEETIEPITIPSDLTEWLECEPNGTITFVNDQKLLVPNTERFIRKLNEVT